MTAAAKSITPSGPSAPASSSGVSAAQALAPQMTVLNLQIFGEGGEKLKCCKKLQDELVTGLSAKVNELVQRCLLEGSTSKSTQLPERINFVVTKVSDNKYEVVFTGEKGEELFKSAGKEEVQQQSTAESIIENADRVWKNHKCRGDGTSKHASSATRITGTVVTSGYSGGTYDMHRRLKKAKKTIARLRQEIKAFSETANQRSPEATEALKRIQQKPNK